MNIYLMVFICIAAGVIGAFVTACFITVNTTCPRLDRDPNEAARQARADIAAAVRRAEERIQSLDQPEAGKQRPR